MDDLPPGYMLNNYRIDEKVGQGGMSTVYKAYHASMDRYVAVKVMSSRLAQDQTFLRRFQQEVRLIARLEHPHIFPVYDYGEHQGIPYLVMRFVNKGTLKDRINRGPLSLDEVDLYFTALSSALSYAHEKGVIHRDIKSLNIMLDERGEAFLSDFGIAKLVADATYTASGEIPGTPAYTSPEQAEGQQADHRSDLYALGVVLYEMLTGQVPFQAPIPLAILLKHIIAQPPPPSQTNPDIPPTIEAVVLKALAKKPEERFKSVLDFLTAWREAVDHAAAGE